MFDTSGNRVQEKKMTQLVNITAHVARNAAEGVALKKWRCARETIFFTGLILTPSHGGKNTCTTRVIGDQLF